MQEAKAACGAHRTPAATTESGEHALHEHGCVARRSERQLCCPAWRHEHSSRAQTTVLLLQHEIGQRSASAAEVVLPAKVQAL